MSAAAGLEAIDLARTFPGPSRGIFGRRQRIHAVEGVSFRIERGEALGLVGETGCGKTTVGRMVAAAITPSSGTVLLNGELFATPMDLQRRAAVQVVFQDTLGALNPRLTIRRQLMEPLEIHGIADVGERSRRMESALASVGLDPQILGRYAHEISGGQRQRIVLARSLIVDPEILICDEAVSALDVSVQANIVNLLSDLKASRGLGYLFISHDLRIVKYLCERIAVMYLGQIAEIGRRDQVFDSPLHPYTRALIDSLPADRPGGKKHRPRLQGEPPSHIDSAIGCVFRSRCMHALPVCKEVRPALRDFGGHSVACHRAGEI